MKIPTKKSFQRTASSLITMPVTFIGVSFILHGTFSNIHWDALLIIVFTYSSMLLIFGDKEEK